MSYILEALKKADAERERGAVPDLHAQPAPLAAAWPAEAQRGPKPWLWLGTGAVIAFGAVLAWQLSGSEAPPGVAPVPSAALAPAQATVPVTPAAAPGLPTGPGASVTPPAVATAPAAAPLAQREAEPLPVPAPVPATSTLPRQPAAAAAPVPRARADARAQAAAASSKPSPASATSTGAVAKAAKGAAEPPAAARAPLLAELPEEFRRQVPAMTIGGSVYSQQPANRMVILNGQVFREGSVVTPGLVLEQIGPKAAVFSLGGQRFQMPF